MAPADLTRAREHWMRGNARGAVNSAWDAVNDALIHGDRVTVEETERLAQVIGESTEGKVRTDAERLASYCRLSLEGVGTGVQASSVVGRMLGRTKKRKCPDCAEKISIEAKVCPHCRYRFPVS